MKKSVWIFLLAVLLPSVGPGWPALPSAAEPKIVFEPPPAAPYQKGRPPLAG